jgi:LPS-assembly protein
MSLFNYLIIFFSIIFSQACFARFSFELGDRFRVLGDKGVKNSIKKTFEVKGNVVIINGPFTMYGGGSLLDFENRTIDVWDNIRLSSSEFTILADKVFIDLDGNKFLLNNGRYEAGNRTLFGERIFKKPNGVIEVDNGNFSTCQECERDWTFFGEKISITPNEYVKINSAYFMVRDVPIFYLPYLVFPIKKNRESGFLFPNISLNTGDGVYFQLPFFWALSDQMDLTFSPGIFGGFGFGNETELRSKYLGFDHLELRHFYLSKDRFDSEVENNQILFLNNINFINQNLKFHLSSNLFSSPELFRSFNQFLKDRVINEYYGSDMVISYKSNFVLFDLNFFNYRNLLSDYKDGQDPDFIQLQPRARFNLKPIEIFLNPNVGSLFFDFTSDIHSFSRSSRDESLIRKYDRHRNEFNLFGTISLLRTLELDYNLLSFHKNYFLGNESKSQRFGSIFKIGSRVSIFRDFFKTTEKVENKVEQNNSYELVQLPAIKRAMSDQNNIDKQEKIGFYRHIIDLRFNYFSTIFYKYGKSNELSSQQIESDFSPNINSLNDLYDIFPGFQFEYGNIVTNQLFPKQKTLFLEFNNTFNKEEITKSLNNENSSNSLRSNKIGHLNFSQGIYFAGEYSGENTELTRFGVDWSLNLSNSFALNGNEFYFFDSKANLSTINLSGNLLNQSYALGIVIDDRSDNKNGFFSISGDLTKQIKFKYLTRRDFSNNIRTENLYKVRYFPFGKCWFYELTLQETLVESRYFFNFALNYNEKLFNNLLSVF